MILNPDLPDNKYRLKILDVLGTKYVLNRIENPGNNETFSTERFKLVWEDQSGWQIYENLKSAPRFFLTNSIELYDTTRDFEEKFFSDGFDPAKNLLMSKKDIGITPDVCPDKEMRGQNVELTRYNPSEVSFSITNSCPVFFFLSDTFDKNWKAEIDGKEAKIVRANYTFRSVYIPEESKTLVFRYHFF